MSIIILIIEVVSYANSIIKHLNVKLLENLVTSLISALLIALATCLQGAMGAGKCETKYTCLRKPIYDLVVAVLLLFGTSFLIGFKQRTLICTHQRMSTSLSIVVGLNLQQQVKHIGRIILAHTFVQSICLLETFFALLTF